MSTRSMAYLMLTFCWYPRLVTILDVLIFHDSIARVELPVPAVDLKLHRRH